jgi:hypothetical protein
MNQSPIQKSMEPVAKLRFCDFNGIDRLRLNHAGRDTGADDKTEGADKNVFLRLPLKSCNFKETNGYA